FAAHLHHATFGQCYRSGVFTFCHHRALSPRPRFRLSFTSINTAPDPHGVFSIAYLAIGKNDVKPAYILVAFLSLGKYHHLCRQEPRGSKAQRNRTMNSILIGGGSKKALYLSWETLAQAQAEGMTDSQILSEIRNTAALFLNSVPGRS